MNLSRRVFLKNSAFALASIGSIPLWGPAFLQKAVFAAEPARSKNGKKILICIFQRGAADGLSMVVPFGDPHYYQHRKEIAIQQPSSKSSENAIDLDGYFGLHPSLAPFLPLYQSGHLAIVHACGSPNNTRSHFDAQDFMESGVANDKSIHTGWLNRTLMCCPEDMAKITPFRAVSMTSIVPRTLQGDQETLAIPDLRTFGVGSNPGIGISSAKNTANGFENLYSNAVDQVLHGTGKESFDAMTLLKKIDVNHYRPDKNAVYPQGAVGRSLMQIAQLIKADVGVEVAFAECGGWDTHANQGNAKGQLSGKLNEFSKAITALYTDLGDRMDDIVILTMSEFGRAVRQNGNRGTDHGHATCFFALGGSINGGKVLGKWPGLATEQLFESRDLAVTTDYRNVFAEVASKHLGTEQYDKIFPNYSVQKTNFSHLLKG